MASYDDDQHPAGDRRKLLNRIPVGSRVLDVGCWSGYFGRYLSARGCTVVGIELDPRAAALAEPHYERVLLGDVLEFAFDGSLMDVFDAVLLFDVLEHVTRPEDVLAAAHRWAPHGTLHVSLPNVAHWSVRKQLLKGSWKYEDSGILDRTHLRFFTRQSGTELLRDSGWNVIWEGYSDSALPLVRRSSRWFTERWPELFAVQLLFQATSVRPPAFEGSLDVPATTTDDQSSAATGDGAEVPDPRSPKGTPS